MRRRGFGLADVLLGLVIVSTLFFAVASLFPIALSSLRKSQHTAVAVHLARQAVETWQAQPFASLVNGTTTTQVDALGNPATSGPELYTVIVTVGDLPTPDTTVKQIDVQVSSQETGQGDVGFAEDTTWVYNFAEPW